MSQDEDLCKVNVIFTVSGTLSHFNTGSASKVALLNQLNIESSRKISSTVRTEDHKLTIIAAKKNQKNLECVVLYAKKLLKNVLQKWHIKQAILVYLKKQKILQKYLT